MAEIHSLLYHFKEAMQALYGGRLAQVWLYGSYARGDQNPQSDIDLLVVLNDEKVEIATEIRCITDTLFCQMPNEVSHFSYVPTALKRFETEFSPLFYFVKKEGILL